MKKNNVIYILISRYENNPEATSLKWFRKTHVIEKVSVGKIHRAFVDIFQNIDRMASSKLIAII